MTGDEKRLAHDAGKRLWRAYEARAARGESYDGALDPLTLAAYLDGTLQEHEREAVEQRLALDDEAVALFLAARETLGRSEAVPGHVVARASALIADPVEPWSPGGLERLRGLFTLPWRPAVAAAAFGIYLLIFLGSFGLGANLGLPSVLEPTTEEPEMAIELFGDGDDWI